MNPTDQPTSKRRVALWMALFNYAQAGIGFLISLWLARQLGSAEYGVLSYGVVAAGICTIVVAFASERTLVRDLVHSSDRAAMMTASVVLRSVMALLVVGGCVTWALFDESLGDKFWPVILCSSWGALLALSPKAWLDCQYKMHVNSGITLSEKCIYAISIVTLLSSGFAGHGATLAAACLFITRLLSVTSEWCYALTSYQPTTVDLGKNIVFLVQQNALILGAAIANLLMTHVNQILLEHTKGSDHLAYYAVAYQIILLVQLLQSQIARLLTPQIAGLTRFAGQAAQLRRSMLRYVFYSFAATLLVILPILVGSPIVIRQVLPDYIESIKPLRLLCLWSLIYGPALIINQFLLGFRLRVAYFVITVSTGILAVVLGQWLLPRFGGSGVAASLGIAHGISVAAQFLVTWRMIGVKAREASSSP